MQEAFQALSHSCRAWTLEHSLTTKPHTTQSSTTTPTPWDSTCSTGTVSPKLRCGTPALISTEPTNWLPTSTNSNQTSHCHHGSLIPLLTSSTSSMWTESSYWVDLAAIWEHQSQTLSQLPSRPSLSTITSSRMLNTSAPAEQFSILLNRQTILLKFNSLSLHNYFLLFMLSKSA